MPKTNTASPLCQVFFSSGLCHAKDSGIYGMSRVLKLKMVERETLRQGLQKCLSVCSLQNCDPNCVCEDSWNNTFSCVRSDRPPHVYKYCVMKDNVVSASFHIFPFYYVSVLCCSYSQATLVNHLFDCVSVYVCVCACLRACVHACVHACVRACVCVC